MVSGVTGVPPLTIQKKKSRLQHAGIVYKQQTASTCSRQSTNHKRCEITWGGSQKWRRVLGRGGGGGTRPWCWFACLWRRLLACRHCTFRPSVSSNVFWSCQRSPWMTCRVWLLQGRPSRRRAVARAVDQVHPDAPFESMPGLPTPALTCARWIVHLQDNFPDRGF